MSSLFDLPINSMKAGATGTQKGASRMVAILGGYQKIPIGDLEKHLDDVRKGRGYLSKNIPDQLFTAKMSSANIFAEKDISSFQLYQQYLTTFSYDKKARFIDGVERAARTLDRII